LSAWQKFHPDHLGPRFGAAVLIAALAAGSQGRAYGCACTADTAGSIPAAAVSAPAPSAGAAPSGRTVPEKAMTKSPRGALIRSAVLPGWGQWYNGAKWKTGLVAAAGIGLGADIAIQNRRAADSISDEEREFYVNNRNLAFWWVAGLYALTLADAYVDAQLWHFDTGPEPGGEPFGGAALRVRMSVSF
jgi:hypothetical protein